MTKTSRFAEGIADADVLDALLDAIHGADRPLTLPGHYGNGAGHFVTICAWCPQSEERTAVHVALGHQVTHTICDACALHAFEED